MAETETSGEQSAVIITPEATGADRTDHGVENTSVPVGEILEPDMSDPKIGKVKKLDPNEEARGVDGNAPRELHTQNVVPTLPTRGNANDSQVRGESLALQDTGFGSAATPIVSTDTVSGK